MSIEELIEEIEGVDADVLPGTISETNRQWEAAEAERSDLDQCREGMGAIPAQIEERARTAGAAGEDRRLPAFMREKVAQ